MFPFFPVPVRQEPLSAVNEAVDGSTMGNGMDILVAEKLEPRKH